MADSETQAPAVESQDAVVPSERSVSEGPNLKYLGFIQSIVLKALAYVTAMYEYAKDSSGPLKPGVYSVEGTVKTVVGPVYRKFEGKPLQLLVLVDSKVDNLLYFVDSVVPAVIKEKSCQAYDVAKVAPDAAMSVVAEVQKKGIYPTAKNYFDEYEPIAEVYGVRAWKRVLQFPLVPQAVGVTRFGCQKVNDIVGIIRDSQLPLTSYLPVLPLEYFDKITKVE